ncbi:ATP-binding protein [Glaciimonas sp. GG7]
MPLDPWLPVRFEVPGGARLRRVVHDGIDWQIYVTLSEGMVLVAQETLARKWTESGLLDEGAMTPFRFGGEHYSALVCSKEHTLAPIGRKSSPNSKAEAISCADAFAFTRRIDPESSLHDAIYAERFSRLLPTYSLAPKVADDIVFGSWISDGVPVSIAAFLRVRSLVGWLGEPHLRDVIDRAGFSVSKTAGGFQGLNAKTATSKPQYLESDDAANVQQNVMSTKFELAGRPELEEFFNEHVIDIIANQERYKALGIDFPSAIILHGPPGCGKTFAIERLVEYLGWPSFQIGASSIASPFIHETSKKVAEVFDQALKNAPSLLIIDEMEAFLADREIGGGSSHHRVEEVAEFLRLIPEAVMNQVLVIAMTNRIEMIDPAILRRGRFDHLVKVDIPSRDEVFALLEKLVRDLPSEVGLKLDASASKLEGRPLSDVSFVVREAARLAARSGKDRLDQDSLDMAMESAPTRNGDEEHGRKIGFV